jgi:hypothetical protein
VIRVTDACRLSLENLGQHKLRTALTMLGMMFGVGAVIAMLSIGAGRWASSSGWVSGTWSSGPRSSTRRTWPR